MVPPAVDAAEPLCSTDDFNSGAFSDLSKSFDPPVQESILLEASRACETEADRRFIVHTVTEQHRMEGVDPDELASSVGMALDLAASNGVSYANAVGGGIGSLVRKTWLHECATRYPEMWAYSDVSISVIGSAGDRQTGVVPLWGPDPATGLVWLPIGTYTPVGSLCVVSYTAGYATVPADLRRAVKYMAASIFARELDPQQRGSHDPGALEALAVAALIPYRRT